MPPNFPVFVVGNSRSGTTLLGRVIGRHPDIFTFQELHFFGELWEPSTDPDSIPPADAHRLAARILCIQETGYLTQGDWTHYLDAAREALRGISQDVHPAEVYRRALHHVSAQHGKVIACDQTPRNLYYLREIMEFFPRAHIINMVRDPRDVLLSQKLKWKRRKLGASNIPLREAVRSWVNYHPITISRLWNSAVDSAESFLDHPRLMTVRYEDFLGDAEASLLKICDFLGVQAHVGQLEVPQIGSSLSSDRTGHTGIVKSNTGKWREGGLSATEVFLCERITRTRMARWSYRLSSPSPSLLELFARIIWFPAHAAAALLLNLKRFRSLLSSIRRRVQ